MAFFVGKAVHFVFYAGAVARAHAFNLAGKHRAAVKAAANDVVGAGVGVGNPARHLLRVLLHPAHKAKHRHRRTHAAGHAVAWLLQALAKVDRSAIQTRRGSGLESALGQLQFFEVRAQTGRWRIARAARGVVVHAHMDLAV